jgi:hypothetical protein
MHVIDDTADPIRQPNGRPRSRDVHAQACHDGQTAIPD